jgi:endonuclease YncB( thermonuclease family)
LFQDRVDVHTKAIAVSMLPWMHHQQRIKEYNRTRCARVVDRSKIVLRYTPKPKISLRQAAMDAPDVWKRGNEISLKQQIVS